MATYEKSGRAIVWRTKSIAQFPNQNLPTLEDILEAARQEFPDCCLADLELIPCGEYILLEERVI